MLNEYEIDTFLVKNGKKISQRNHFIFFQTVFPNVPTAPGMSCVGEDRK